MPEHTPAPQARPVEQEVADVLAAGGHTYSATWAPDRHDISEADDD